LELDLAETAATANMMKTTRVAITKSLERIGKSHCFSFILKKGETELKNERKFFLLYTE